MTVPSLFLKDKHYYAQKGEDEKIITKIGIFFLLNIFLIFNKEELFLPLLIQIREIKNKNPLKRGDLESDESLKIKDIQLSQFRIPLHLEVS